MNLLKISQGAVEAYMEALAQNKANKPQVLVNNYRSVKPVIIPHVANDNLTIWITEPGYASSSNVAEQRILLVMNYNVDNGKYYYANTDEVIE